MERQGGGFQAGLGGGQRGAKLPQRAALVPGFEIEHHGFPHENVHNLHGVWPRKPYPTRRRRVEERIFIASRYLVTVRRAMAMFRERSCSAMR